MSVAAAPHPLKHTYMRFCLELHATLAAFVQVEDTQ